MKSEIIFYALVSTRRQGKSGLGLGAQRKAVQSFADAEAFWIVSEFVEVEAGKGADALNRRPQLKAALAEAKRRKCSIVTLLSSTGSRATSSLSRA
jgi:DNA invertase Pin-like site-specific DNA recombinase